MPTTIPQSLSEEETKEVLSVHGFKEGILLFVLIATSLIFVIKSPFPYQVNIFLVGIYIIFFFIGFRYLDKNFYKLVLFNKSFKNISFFDSRMDYFLNVRNIKNNALIFNDNSMMSILLVKSIDGSLLEEEEMQTVIDIFDSVLKSIPHTIHIFSHSVEPSLDDFFASNEKKIIEHHSRRMQEILKSNQIKEKWLMEKMKETRARDRENYLAVVYKPSIFQSVEKPKEHFSKKQKNLTAKKTSELIAESNFRELRSLINSTAKQLEKTGVRANLLSDDDLISFYPSYFMNIKGIGMSNLSPIMWHEGD